MNNLWILAEVAGGQKPEALTSEPVTSAQTTTKTAADGNTAGQKTQPPSTFGLQQMLLLGLMVVIFYFLLFRGPKKKQQEQIKMVKSLQKNDKVQTIGGILGTVVDVSDDVVTLKIDEANNTKIKVTVAAIGRNLSRDQK